MSGPRAKRTGKATLSNRLVESERETYSFGPTSFDKGVEHLTQCRRCLPVPEHFLVIG